MIPMVAVIFIPSVILIAIVYGVRECNRDLERRRMHDERMQAAAHAHAQFMEGRAR